MSTSHHSKGESHSTDFSRGEVVDPSNGFSRLDLLVHFPNMDLATSKFLSTVSHDHEQGLKSLESEIKLRIARSRYDKKENQKTKEHAAKEQRKKWTANMRYIRLSVYRICIVKLSLFCSVYREAEESWITLLPIRKLQVSVY